MAMRTAAAIAAVDRAVVHATEEDTRCDEHQDDH
jgi:hypothetical protein